MLRQIRRESFPGACLARTAPHPLRAGDKTAFSLENRARETCELPCPIRPAEDQRARIPSQTASAEATAGFSTSQSSKHRRSVLACPVGGFSACHRRGARSGSQQLKGCRVVSLLAASANNRPTSYETDRNARLPDAAKRSSPDISSSPRNSKDDQERRSGEQDATAASG